MDETNPYRAPAHLWVLGILSLLWNCYGAYDYVMSHIGTAQSLGLSDETIAWLRAFPAWVTGAWAIGVWVSLAGSLLLLLRSRRAQTAFLVSLAGTLVSFAYQFSSDRPAELQGGVALVMPLVIVIMIVAQWYYARRMSAAGVLR